MGDKLYFELDIGEIEKVNGGIKLAVLGGVAVLAFSREFGSPKKLNADVPFRSLIVKYSVKNGLDPCLVAAVIQKESSFNPSAVNPGDPSFGLGQLKLETARQFEPEVTRDDLFNPETNIRLMCRFLAWLKKNGVPYPEGIHAYNVGLQGYRSGHTPNPPNYSQIVISYMGGLCDVV